MTTATNYINPNSAYYLQLDMTESDVDVSNNTSKVRVVGSIHRVGSTYKAYNSSSSNTVTINGTQYNPTSSYNVWDNWESQIFDYTQTITHNDDGSKSISIYWSFNGNMGSYNPNGSISYTLALTTIARKSVPTVSTSSISMPASGNAVTVYTNRKSSSFTHTVTLKIGSTQIAQRTGVGASTTFTYADLSSIYSTLPSSTSATVSVTCETFNGSTSLGSNSTSFSVTINNGAKPTFSNYTYADTNSTVTAITGNNQVLVQYQSTPTITISSANKATANYSASISKYSMNFAQASAVVSYSTSDITQSLASPTQSGSLVMTVSAIDSREYATAVTKTVTVVPYANPVINASATRTGNYYSETTLSIAGSFSGVPVSGTNKNTIDTTSGVQYRYKKSSDSTWGSWTNRAITISGTSYSATDLILSFDNSYQWDIQVQATDKFATTTVSLTLPVGLPIMYIGKDGRVSLGGVPTIGKPSSHNAQLEVNGSVFGDWGSQDTRSANSTPADYMGNGRQTKNEFKYNSVIGAPFSSEYSNVFTVTPCGDSSGGTPTQIAISEDEFQVRKSSSTSVWSAWIRVPTYKFIGNTGNANNLTQEGVYGVYSGTSNLPTGIAYGYIKVERYADGRVLQICNYGLSWSGPYRATAWRSYYYNGSSFVWSDWTCEPYGANGDWGIIGSAMLSSNTTETVFLKVAIPTCYQGNNMQYKIAIGAETNNSGANVAYIQPYAGTSWRTGFSFHTRTINANGNLYGESYSGSSVFGCLALFSSAQDSSTSECIVGRAGSSDYWNFSGHSGGVYVGAQYSMQCGGRTNFSDAITAFRLVTSSSTTLKAGSNLTVWARRMTNFGADV